jgi:hypothetical protein
MIGDGSTWLASWFDGGPGKLDESFEIPLDNKRVLV